MRKVSIERKQRVLDDFFKVDEAFLTYEKFDGRMSDTVRRLNFERGDAAAALLYNRDSEKIILVEQFRYPTYEKSGGWMLEVVAGIIDPGEEPDACIRREITEETGFKVGSPVHINTFYLSPGGSSERIFLYFAEVTDADRISEGGGVDTENEDIKITEFSLKEIRDAMKSGNISDAKTIIALMWFLNRGER
jgi:nudix-type nucleoside diphosphatase (YffH/AdpP family)